MAANYWASTQRLYWQYSKDELADIRQKLEDEDRNLVQQYSTPDRRLLSIFFNSRASQTLRNHPITRLKSLRTREAEQKFIP